MTKKTKPEKLETHDEEAALTCPTREELEAQLLAAEQKAQENWDKATRAVAELENIRKRATRDVEHAHKYGLEKFVQHLIPVVDSLEQALSALENTAHQEAATGIALTLKLFLDALSKHDVRQIDPLNQSFDPKEHEAMSIQISEEASPNTVLTVFQKGYKLHDRVVRAARVIVAKANDPIEK